MSRYDTSSSVPPSQSAVPSQVWNLKMKYEDEILECSKKYWIPGDTRGFFAKLVCVASKLVFFTSRAFRRMFVSKIGAVSLALIGGIVRSTLIWTKDRTFYVSALKACTI